MKIWVSGEINKDVDRAFRSTRTVIERKFNKAFGQRVYGSNIEKISLILIIVPKDIQHIFPEFQKLHVKKKDLELRVFIDHSKFKAGNAKDNLKLSLRAVIKFAKKSCNFKTHDFDIKKFTRDLYKEFLT